MVRCTPTEPGAFRSRFRFVVEHGQHVELDVTADATLDEGDDAYHITERQPEDFVFR